MPLAILVPLLGYTLLIGLALPGRPELALFGAVSALIAAVYAAALAGVLEPAALVLFWAGVAAVVAGPFLPGHRARVAVRGLLAPGGVRLAAAAVAQWSAFRAAEFSGWDEFSHWGLAAREVLHHHRLWDGTGNVRAFAHYPPATTLWQYFVVRNTVATEAAVLFAQFLLLAAPLAVLYRGTQWRRPHWILAILALQVLLVANLGLGPASLYVDHILAVFLAAIVVACLAEDPGARALAPIAAACFSLALVKESGALLAAAAAVWIAVDRLAVSERRRGRASWPRWLAVAGVLAAPLLAHASWDGYRARHDIGDPATDSRPRVGAVARTFLGGAEAYQKTTMHRFAEVVLRQPVARSPASEEYNEFSYAIRDRGAQGFRLSAAGYLALALGLLAIRAGLAVGARRTLWWTLAFLALVAALYLGLLLILYLHVLEPHRAVELVSFVRYADTALLALLLVAFAGFLPLANRFGWRWPGAAAGAVILAAALAALYAVETPHLEPFHRPRHDAPLRRQIAAATARVKQSVPRDATVYVVSTVRDDGFTEVLLRYELSPLRTTFGFPASADDLRGHDYLWIHALDAAAAARLGGALASGYRLFRLVERDGELGLRSEW